MSKTEPRNYIAESEFVKAVMSNRGLIAGYVPYGHAVHIWKAKGSWRPLCGSKAGYRNQKRPIAWGDGVCRQCLQMLRVDAELQALTQPPANRALVQKALEIALEWKGTLLEDSCAESYLLMIIELLRRALEGEKGAQD